IRLPTKRVGVGRQRLCGGKIGNGRIGALGKQYVAERRIPDVSPLIGARLADCPARVAIKPYALSSDDNFACGPRDQG
ncbi:hypothetical protein ACC731_38400, partial [Rhizobium ruizarguesonis]